MNICGTALFLALMVIGSAAKASFLPEKDLRGKRIPVLSGMQQNITEGEFHTIVQSLQKFYEGEVSKLGGKLKINGDWKSEKLNAAATQIFGSWNVVISGGLARHPKLTADGFTLILCHELGHHLGGFAFGAPMPPFMPAWAASEGQADYFAAHSCTRRVWKDEIEKNRQVADTASTEIRSLCQKTWSRSEDFTLCARTLVGIESLIATMADLKKIEMPSFSTPDPKVVSKTNPEHPEPQCRMDTSLQATLCTANFNPAMIPGKSVKGGVSSPEAEAEAAKVTCTRSSGFEIGLRPRCWYYPRM